MEALDRTAERYREFAPTLLRVALAAVFLYHGWVKLLAWGPSVGFFAQIGIPFPAFSLVIVEALELLGGLALLLGLGVRYLTPLFAFHMFVGIVTVHGAKGFDVFRGGWEFNFVLILICAALFLTGPGAWSLGGGGAGRRP